jgi:xanthine/CO dehydrogenase XdhC/CoxF family maturation factor
VKEIKLFVGQLSLYIKSGVKFAIATVVNVDGSAYRRPGARMLINENGDWHGGISGGCLEGDMLKKAQMSMLSNQNKLVKYDTREDDPFELGVGLGCNGLIEILISPDLEYAKCLLELLIAHVQSSDPTILEHSFHLNSTHSSFVQINSTQPFVSVLSKEDSEEVLIQHQSKLLALENELIFVEYLPAIPRIVVYGNLFDSSSLIEVCVFLLVSK